jgi:hypothetical protein
MLGRALIQIAPGTFLVDDTCNPLVRPHACSASSCCSEPRPVLVRGVPDHRARPLMEFVWSLLSLSRAAGVHPDLQDRERQAVRRLQALS